MPRTPLHALLGESSHHLDFDLIVRACTEAVTEREDLDWKRDLPLTADRSHTEAKTRQQRELAKDIAAMANSGGGMIVFGVGEARGSSAAASIEPVGPVDEATVRDIRRVAGNLIYPPVVGLDLVALHPSSEPDAGVLVLLVPDSQDRPHLMHPGKGANQDWFGVPYRHGPDTEWMRERQIAATYAEREQGRRRREEDFDRRYAAFTSSLPGGPDVRWVVALAVPVQPLPHPRRLTPSNTDAIFTSFSYSPLSSTRTAPGRTMGPAELLQHEPSTQGLRRVVRQAGRRPGRVKDATMRARAEVHDDSSIAVAYTRDGAFPGEPRQGGQVAVVDLEVTATDFLALLLAVREWLGVSSDYAVRLSVHPPAEIFRRSDPHLLGQFAPWDERRVLGYRPVDGTVLTSDEEVAIASWVDVARDAVNQTGSACLLDPARLHAHLIAER